jgi:Aspartyl protease
MHDSRTLRLLLLCVSLIGAHADLAIAQDPILATTPMLECSGLPCVDVNISGAAHLKMLIDTGNQTSMLDKATAEKLGLPLKPALGLDGKPYPGYSIATVKNVQLGSIALEDMKFLVADFQPDIKSGTFPRPSRNRELRYNSIEAGRDPLLRHSQGSRARRHV